MSCERHRQVYEYISMGLGHLQLVHRRVAHDLKYGLWFPQKRHHKVPLSQTLHCAIKQNFWEGGIRSMKSLWLAGISFYVLMWCFSSIWWSIMIKLYLNFLLTSIFWWKTSHFNRKWGWKVNQTECIPFNPTFCQNCDVFSSKIDMKFRYSLIMEENQP